MKKKVHVVPHMHWDREWYFSTEESRILLVNNMEEILARLETDAEYSHYVLDGQTSILEDYFAVKPEAQARVKRLVQAGRLIIGPWYTQTDEMIVGGESIVRNLLYGIKDTKAFGAHMKIGYLPDSFGQSSQMPQILNGFDIKYSIFWRGTSERHGTDKTEFYWESDEGSKVLVQLLPLGYAIGKYLPVDEDLLAARMEKYFPVLDRGATSEHLILPNGHDQMPLQKNIYDVLEQLSKLYPDREFFLSKYENVLREIEKNPNLDTLKGEFLDGKYMRVHRSIYSTRMDIKAANTRIENKITHVLEPLATMAHRLGFEYHHGLIELIWKEIMKNHAHDSIGCCCSDKVHREIMNRFFLAEEKVDQLIGFYQRKIVDSMQTTRTEDRLTAFNLLPERREEVMRTQVITKFKHFKLVDEEGAEIAFEQLHGEELDPGLIDRQIVHYGNYDPFMKVEIQFKDTLPSMGYKTYFVVEADAEVAHGGGAVSALGGDVSSRTVETEHYAIFVNENGTLRILDRAQKKTFDEVFLLEDGADDGDEYDYSPLAGEVLISNRDVQAEIEVVHGKDASEIRVSYVLVVPADLQARKASRLDGGHVGVSCTVRVAHHQKTLAVKFTLDNQAKDHRLRLLIPTGLAPDCSVSDNQFGYVKRDVRDAAMDVWEQEGWDERPDAIYPMLSFVGVSDETSGVAIFTNSTREFELIGDAYDTIAVTLFRSIGVLGKENLVRRPGRPSGIKLPTPDSQMIGVLELDLGLHIHAGSTLGSRVGRLARAYATPVVFYNKIPHNAMKLNEAAVKTPPTFSLFSENVGDAVLSTVKKAEASDAVLVRLFNPTDQPCRAELEAAVASARLVKLNEEELDALTVSDGKVTVELLPNQVKTLALELVDD